MKTIFKKRTIGSITGDYFDFMAHGFRVNGWKLRLLRSLLMPFFIVLVACIMVGAIAWYLLVVVISPLWYIVTGESLIRKLDL